MNKILVIDDEVNIIKAVSMYLEGHHYEVVSVLEGLEGINEAKNFLPDLILLDLILPDMDGFLVCQALKSNITTNDIPVVVMSAKSQECDKVKAKECGAIDYIVKPFKPEMLIETIQKHIKEN
ncbi:MAG: response regulator [Clostridia bacterium]|nr:response regulator [Clostridia bacterium]